MHTFDFWRQAGATKRTIFSVLSDLSDHYDHWSTMSVYDYGGLREATRFISITCHVHSRIM